MAGVLSLSLITAPWNTAQSRETATTETLLLSGTSNEDPVDWDFYCTAGRRSGSWTKIGVPSCWELKGFGTYNYGNEKLETQSSERGLYKRNFKIPADWADRRVDLVFEGSMTDTSVKINGVSAGEVHQGAFTQFRYDISSLLKYGASNLIEVEVSKKSANASINDAERTADYWIFGGIFRPVYLESRPRESIQRVAIDARADGTFTARVSLNGISTATKLIGRIETLAGKDVGPAFSIPLSADSTDVSMTTTSSGIVPWNSEKPALYRLVLDLEHDGTRLHTITQPFGFRSVEVRAGDGIYLNGVKIRLKGVNRHTFRPDSGRTSSPKQAAEAIELIRGLNANAVRMSHYPPDQYFLDQCDAAGLLVLDEVPGWQGAYDDTVAPRIVRETVERDVNHPSVIFWDNGNEGGWNKTVDESFGRYDPQHRTVLHPGGETFHGINALHYPTYSALQKDLKAAPIRMPTEFLHGLYDGGLGAGIQDYWDLMVASPKSAGGFLWSFADEGVVRVDLHGKIDTYGNNAPDGLVGPFNEKEPSYDTVRDVWSPVQVVRPLTLTSAFDGKIPLRNDYFFTTLSSCRFKWEILDFPRLSASRSTGATVVDSAMIGGPAVPAQQVGNLQVELPVDWSRHDALRLTAFDREGRSLRSWTWPIQSQEAMVRANLPTTSAAASATESGSAIFLKGNGTEISIGRTTGLIESVRAHDSPISLSHGPRIVGGTATLSKVTRSRNGNDQIVTASFSGVLQTIVYRMRGDGWLKVDYQFTPVGGQPLAGVTFDYPPDKVTGLRWLGDGPQPVWANRMAGPSLAVWQKTANNAVPGYRWTKEPVFRGYHSNLCWAVLKTTQGPIELLAETPKLFLRVLTPENGPHPENATFSMPPGDLSLLHTITPIGNKFHKAADTGPMAESPPVSTEPCHGAFWLHFGDPK
jgi:hypothetical protein